MKQKIKTVVFSLSLAFLGGIFFTSCDQDSFDLKKDSTSLSADDYAVKLVESLIDINRDLITRNQQIFDLPDRFTKELDLLSKVANYQELESLISTTPLDLDFSIIDANTKILEEISEALSKNAFTRESLVAEVKVQSQNQEWLPANRITLRRDQMDCIRDYDATNRTIAATMASCVAGSLVKNLGLSSPLCGVIGLAGIVGANVAYYDCVKQTTR